jgi:hypothetical protein
MVIVVIWIFLFGIVQVQSLLLVQSRKEGQFLSWAASFARIGVRHSGRFQPRQAALRLMHPLQSRTQEGQRVALRCTVS